MIYLSVCTLWKAPKLKSPVGVYARCWEVVVEFATS